MSQGISKVAVIGAGQMGSGIAQVFATKGFKTTIIDLSETQLEKAKSGIENSLAKFVSKNLLSQADADKAIELLSYNQQLESASDCDLVIEAIIENEQIKKDVLIKLDQITPNHAILASNTSSLPITRLAAATKRPEKVIGMHFMNPVPIMKLVEIIPGIATSDETLKTITELAVMLGKEVSTSKDYPGFVVNRILMPMINEAFTALMEGVATPEDIDKGMKLGTNQPMGPLTLADFIGLDTCLAIMRVLHVGLGDSKYRPSPLLVQYVDAGWYGRKTGRGVYKY